MRKENSNWRKQTLAEGVAEASDAAAAKAVADADAAEAVADADAAAAFSGF